IGEAGLTAVRQLRLMLAERYDDPQKLTHLKFLFLDTDPETLVGAAEGPSGMALGADEILALRLNRGSHYLKPRRNGRSLIEGWFDPQMLYRIPRNLVVQGVRALGRLAFGDHYRAIIQHLETALETVGQPQTMRAVESDIGLTVRSNRPRVYVITGLG